MTPLLRMLLVAPLAAMHLPPQDAESRPAPLVRAYEGALPIVLSAPHGGQRVIPGAKERQGKGVKQFTVVRDERTDELAVKIADGLEKRLGARPYVTTAEFARKYADANREPETAYESPEAKAAYDAYHAELAKACGAVRARFGGGLLLDVHGQGADKKAIFRGSADGATVKHLVDTFGKEAFVGPSSICGALARAGYAVFPKEDGEREDDRFDGGFIVRKYGSRDGGKFDALQLEFGTELRERARLEATADAAAGAIAAFAEKYLLKATASKPASAPVGRK